MTGVQTCALPIWNNVTTADFDQRGNTEGCTRITSFTNGAYKEWTLNETARGWIARSGETKPATASASGKTQLGIRNGNKDIDNSAPTDGTIYIAIQSSDYTGTDHDPYLSVTYEATTGPTHLKKLNGIASANIKKINGIAIANVKKINSVD